MGVSPHPARRPQGEGHGQGLGLSSAVQALPDALGSRAFLRAQARCGACTRPLDEEALAEGLRCARGRWDLPAASVAGRSIDAPPMGSGGIGWSRRSRSSKHPLYQSNAGPTLARNPGR